MWPSRLWSRLAERLVPTAAGQPYKCRRCGERFEVEYHRCPTCDGPRVERVDWDRFGFSLDEL